MSTINNYKRVHADVDDADADVHENRADFVLKKIHHLFMSIARCFDAIKRSERKRARRSNALFLSPSNSSVFLY